MGYYLNMGGWAGVFAVPNSIVDKHLKLCGETELKVILWALRHSGETFDPEQVSAGTGIPAKFAGDAFDFWVQQGVLAETPAGFSQAEESPGAPAAQPLPPSPAPLEPAAFAAKKMLRPDGIYIAKRMQECPDLMHLMAETENALGKTLSPSLAAVLINAHDDYGLPSEVIMLIISYAVSVGKTTTSYLEAVTKEWSESGIFSLDAAEQKLNDLNEHSIAWKKLSTALGLPFRSPTKKEDEFSYKWLRTWNFEPDVIRESYERCVNNIGKMQMSYMDKILAKWESLGLHSLNAIHDYEESLKAAKENRTATYDLGNIENMDFFSMKDHH